MPPEWNKILIIKLRAIGDVILTTPVFQNLRAQFPNCQIDFIVEKPAYPLVAENPDLDNIWIAPYGEELSFKNDQKFFKNIRRQKYDVCFDLFGNPRSALISLFSRTKLRVGFDFRIRKYAYHIKIPSRAAQVHEVKFNLDALNYFDIPVKSEQPRIFMKKSDLKKARTIMKELDYNQVPVIALNPSASWPAKKWPLNYFADLGMSVLENFNARILVLWGPGELDDAKKLADKIGSYAAVHPATDISEQAALLSLCNLYVGNDTSPMHMAAAVGIPTVGIFGPTNARLQGLFGKNSMAVFNSEIACLGCDQLDCRQMDCMNDLKPETVFAQVKDFIKKQGVME